jgi:hypothetical protein
MKKYYKGKEKERAFADKKSPLSLWKEGCMVKR